MGRLALFYHFEGEVQRRMEQAIRDLSAIQNQEKSIGDLGQVTRGQGINAFVVTSSCGGTGSGTFIDVAYLIKAFCEKNGIKGEGLFTTGVIVLPQAFATVPGQAIKANTYAALLELDHFSESGKFQVRYPTEEVNIDARPFNICYLVDAVNERGKMLSGLAELAPMIAESLFLQTASQIGDVTKSVFDNVKALDQITEEGNPTCYSGIGTASLIFPAQVIVDACAARFLVDLIVMGLAADRSAAPAVPDDLLGQPDEAARLAGPVQEAADIANRAGLSVDHIETELIKDPKGKPIRIRLDPTLLDKVPDAEMYSRTELLVQQFEDMRLNDLFRKWTEENLQAMRKALLAQLSQDHARLMDSPAQGPYFTLAVFHLLQGHVRDLQRAFTTKYEQAETQINQDAKRTGDLRTQLQNTIRSTNPLRKSARIRADRDKYLKIQEGNLTRRFEIRVYTQAQDLLANVNRLIEQKEQDTHNLLEKLESARKRLERLAAELSSGHSRTASPLTYEITDAEDVERTYRELVPDVQRQQARFLEAAGGLTSVAALDYEQVYNLLLGFGRDTFAPVHLKKIEDVIKGKSAWRSPDDRLEVLRQDSVPFWNIDLTRMPEAGSALQPIVVIGVENKSDSLYTGKVRTGEQLTTTRDPHSLTVLHTKHGLAVNALQQWDDYRRAYELHLRRKVSPLHIFDMGDPRRARTVFALGEAFGFINVTPPANYYYEIPAEHATLSTRVDLDRGLPNTIRMFENAPNTSAGSRSW